MAGIGFELRKVVSRGGITGFFQAAFSGSMIVAGPWLLSIVTISVMQHFLSSLFTSSPGFFMGVIIYTYTFSLVLFGGWHYLITRMISDFIYMKREREGAGIVFYCVAVVVPVSAAAAFAGLFLFPAQPQLPGLYSFGVVLLFVSINSIWILMLYITLLKWFMRIFLVYAAGMVISLAAVFVLGERFGVSGGLAGFAAGHAVIAIFLSILVIKAYPPCFPGLKKAWEWMKKYIKSFMFLLLTGYLYTIGIWVDKIVFWFSLGEKVESTAFYLFGNYDLFVYYANLTMIPGLIFFVIWAETSFYTILRKFLVSMTRGRYPEIQKRKYLLRSGLRQVLIDQVLFQGVLTVSLLVLSFRFPSPVSVLFRSGEGSPYTLQILLLGVFFHLLFLTILNYHFYLELYTRSMVLSFLYCIINTVMAVVTVAVPVIPPGTSYCAAGIVASVTGWWMIFFAIKTLDRRIFLRVDTTVLDTVSPPATTG